MVYKPLRAEMIKHNDSGAKLFDEIDKYIRELEDYIKKLKGGNKDDKIK